MSMLCWENGHRRHRVWIDEPSGWEYAAVPGCLREQVACETGIWISNRQVTVETFAPMGGIVLYGLLGLRLEPRMDRQCLVEVCPGEERLSHERSLAAGVDKVTVGLPEEFCPPVFLAICEALRSANVRPQGRLVVSAAGAGSVGTCAFIMEGLVRAAVRLLCDSEATDDRIRSIVEWELLAIGSL